MSENEGERFWEKKKRLKDGDFWENRFWLPILMEFWTFFWKLKKIFWWWAWTTYIYRDEIWNTILFGRYDLFRKILSQHFSCYTNQIFTCERWPRHAWAIGQNCKKQWTPLFKDSICMHAGVIDNTSQRLHSRVACRRVYVYSHHSEQKTIFVSILLESRNFSFFTRIFYSLLLQP